MQLHSRAKLLICMTVFGMSSLTWSKDFRSFSSDITCIANERSGSAQRLVKLELDSKQLVMRVDDQLVCENDAIYRSDRYVFPPFDVQLDDYDRCIGDAIDVFAEQAPDTDRLSKLKHYPVKITGEDSMYIRFVLMSPFEESGLKMYVEKDYMDRLGRWQMHHFTKDSAFGSLYSMGGIADEQFRHTIPCWKKGRF